MKNRFIIYGGLLILLCSSCKKWVDVRPDTVIKQADLFSSESGFEDALTGVYMQLSIDTLYGVSLTMKTLDLLAQQYQKGDYDLAPYFNYDYGNDKLKVVLADIWSNMYRSIGNINNILEQIDQHNDLFTKDHYARIKGEALGLRAFLHFDLLRMFGPAGVGNSAVSCIPYVTKYKKTVTTFSSVSAVVAQCLDDVKAAEKLLEGSQQIYTENNDRFAAYSRNHFNYWATLALQARIYLYKGDVGNAYQYAVKVINSGYFPFVTQSGRGQDPTYATEHVFALSISKLKTWSDGCFARDVTLNYLPDELLYQTPDAINELYDVEKDGMADYRRELQVASGDIVLTSKYAQSVGVTRLAMKNQMPLIRLSEMYYIASETAVDSVSQWSYLNSVRKHRGLPELDPDLNNIRDAITAEYRKEFYAEGQLFYYYKRLNKEVIPWGTRKMSADTYVFPLPDDEIQYRNQ
ncbi:MAG TPA: RagB/SusD family nutrient uptake outer membrane protein [Chitinophaga sp.]|uniref:RagB/SusD family nutrient uptake outer membrane protein n=1 Tax=Chitinophaga sp. TaxID=1869181 RepID=UPI002C489AAE|nr:RagB/SusD family nutrient uptake outer membrane protein [Chitinophaga sp.]HVI48453.1 RagB/SusD family nutrient uptake outer membrane protein [Chitinophaga sp.]